MRRGRAASLGPPDPVTAPAVVSTLTAPADVLESAPAESSLTDISEASFQTTSEETQIELKSEVSTSDSETMDGYNINREISIPTSVRLSNEQERIRVTPEEATQGNPGRHLPKETERFHGRSGKPRGRHEPRPGPRTSNPNGEEPGKSAGKGKGPDPREWGDAQLSEDELNPEIQQQVLEACSIRQEAPTELGEDEEPPSEQPSEREDT
ncbi:hypothetical protein E4T56_gene11325 [Termitomyces sp. T112]|nr:hypothetical protein C0989_000751 [Termitomyces sp. Mn162]KAG5732409.1 hypothetical protein E4T56_gene11325 [Termitomyces sp. T112]